MTTTLMDLSVVAAPSNSRPQISREHVIRDAEALKKLLGDDRGIGGLTEMSHPSARRAWKTVFDRHHRVMPARADAPIALGGNWHVLDSGKDFGCHGVGRVAPARTTTWALLQPDASALKIGVESVHMMPGVWHPSADQSPYVPVLHQEWYAHESRINHRHAWLAELADVVIRLGDINHPGLFAFPGDRRISTEGLVYIGVHAAPGVHVTFSHPRPHKQYADHQSQSTILTIEKKV